MFVMFQFSYDWSGSFEQDPRWGTLWNLIWFTVSVKSLSLVSIKLLNIALGLSDGCSGMPEKIRLSVMLRLNVQYSFFHYFVFFY